jgi:endonuclease/exonuclease/phosphatase family metal-dependent hydrolase
LQLNLCNSGLTACYTGLAVGQAEVVLRQFAPDLITLNEVCRDDVTILGNAAADVHGGQTVAWAFQPLPSTPGGANVVCTNGQAYGIGLIARVAQEGYTTSAGYFPDQESADMEVRGWLCIATEGLVICTTHLTSIRPETALEQCRYLFAVAIPSVYARSGGPVPTVIGGDFNLRQVRSCVPADHPVVDDGDVQYFLTTADLAVAGGTRVDMAGTTDHPGLYITLSDAGR